MSSNASLDTIARFVQQRSRLSFSEHRKSFLKQRLEERRASLKLPDLVAYWNYLRHSAQEELLLLDSITVNETSFFRNAGQFRFLSEFIIPELESGRELEVVRAWQAATSLATASTMKIRILCAGCSTGEEPYSLAMALLSSLKFPKIWDIEILACDLSDTCIRKAQAGFYETERLKGIPADFLERFTDRCERGVVIKEEIKRIVRFCRLNLNDIMRGEDLPGIGAGRGYFDIVFCRNVLIYLSSDGQQELVDTLFSLLSSGGYLFTGDAEPLHLYSHNFKSVREAGALLYKKIGA